MPKLFLTLGDKGGIGKSFVAVLMTQYFLENTAVKPLCFDLDPKNRTFSRYKGLDAELIDVRTDGDIDRGNFDILINRVLQADQDDVIIADVGGNVYVPMTDYLKVNQILELMLSVGTKIVMHIPIVGGGDLFPTLQTLDELMNNTPEEITAAIWINQKNGKVEYKGKQFEESERFLQYEERIHTVTYIPLWRPDMQRDVAEMLEDATTFHQAFSSKHFGLIQKQRLVMAQRYLYDSIRRSGVCE